MLPGPGARPSRPVIPAPSANAGRPDSFAKAGRPPEPPGPNPHPWRAGEDRPRAAARARSGSGIWLSAEESFVGKSSLWADGEAVVRSGQRSEVRQLLGVVDVTGETNLAAHRRSNFLRSSRGISLITKTPGLCPELVGLNARGPLKVHQASWCWRALRRPGSAGPSAATARTRTRPVVAGDQGAGLGSRSPIRLRSMTANDVNRGKGTRSPRGSLLESA